MESNITTSADDSSRTATNRRQPSACSAASEISASRWRSRLHDDGVTERATFTSFSLAMVSSPAAAQTVAACTPSTPTHQRQRMKARPEPATLAAGDITTRTIADIVKLAVPRQQILTDA